MNHVVFVAEELLIERRAELALAQLKLHRVRCLAHKWHDDDARVSLRLLEGIVKDKLNIVWDAQEYVAYCKDRNYPAKWSNQKPREFKA